MLTYHEFSTLARAPRALFPTGHPVGLDFEALQLFERELDGEVGVGSDTHDHVIGWDDDIPVDDDQAMADGHVGMRKNSSVSANTGVGVRGGDPSGDVGRNAIPTASSRSGIGSGDGSVDARSAVSRSYFLERPCCQAWKLVVLLRKVVLMMGGL